MHCFTLHIAIKFKINNNTFNITLLFLIISLLHKIFLNKLKNSVLIFKYSLILLITILNLTILLTIEQTNFKLSDSDNRQNLKNGA